MLRWHGGLAGSCTMWRGLGVCWVGVAGRGGSAGSWRVLGRGGGESVGGGVLRAVLGWRGGRWRLGLACHIEAAWRVGGVLVCHVGLARWVGGGGVAGQDGGGSHARMGCNLQAKGLVPCWGGEVGWRWWGRMGVARVHEWAAISRVLRCVGAARWVGSGGVLEQDGGGLCARMAVLRAVLGWRVGGGGVLRAMSGRRVGAGTNGSGSRAQGRAEHESDPWHPWPSLTSPKMS
ncbi:hypothetical protein EDB89DRAFT_1913263 [Lactarius sanguifluus]|nr:hypothetical protein EDB89DRAFT_1913263 [Lactarius sanguifluus]